MTGLKYVKVTGQIVRVASDYPGQMFMYSIVPSRVSMVYELDVKMVSDVFLPTTEDDLKSISSQVIEINTTPPTLLPAKTYYIEVNWLKREKPFVGSIPFSRRGTISLFGRFIETIPEGGDLVDLDNLNDAIYKQ